MRGDCTEISFRLDGIVTPVKTLPKEIAERVFGRIKYLARSSHECRELSDLRMP